MIEFKRRFFKFWFDLFGWKVVGDKPKDLKKYVIIVAPHTSNYDFFVGLAAKHIIDLHSHFLGKDSLFKIPLVGWFMRQIGGYPVDRSKNNNLVDQVVGFYQKHDEFVIALTPEGTRSYAPKWRTGFYHIAQNANVPIMMVGFDYSRKIVEFREPYFVSGDKEKDIEEMKAYFRNFKGKHLEKGIL